MSSRAVRRIVIAVCVVGIAGMIVSSILDNTGAALTAGLITAVAVLCLIVATAVTRTDPAHEAPGAAQAVESLAAEVEEGITSLVEAGADETRVREVVGAAVRLGRARS